MNYTITKPEGYEKVPLPGLNKWAEALKSGKYEQGRGWLRDGSKYCCLGVLCEVQGRLKEHRESGMEAWGEGVLSESNPAFGQLKYEGHLPSGVAVTVSLAVHHFVGSNPFTDLVSINDHSKLPFSDIADILRQIYIDPLETLTPSP